MFNYQLGHRGWEVSELKIPVYIVFSLISVLVFFKVRILSQFGYPPKYGEQSLNINQGLTLMVLYLATFISNRYI